MQLPESPVPTIEQLATLVSNIEKLEPLVPFVKKLDNAELPIVRKRKAVENDHHTYYV